MRFSNSCFRITFLALLFPSLMQAEPWTHISIKSAFVSQATYEANRDFFSSPEFGWNIRSGGALVMRGDLYGDLFAPESKSVELVFVEQDIAMDDVITSFVIPEKHGSRELTSGQDRFTIEISSFDPEAKSGTDLASPVELKAPVTDTVSFLDQDRTDSYRVTQKFILVYPDFPSIDVAAESCKNVDENNRLLLFQCEKPGSLRVQSDPGSSRTSYAIEGAASLDALLVSIDSRTRKDSFLRGAAFSLLEKLGRLPAEQACSRNKTLPICGYYLYRTGDRAARESLRKLARDQAYTDALNQAEEESSDP
jgi:hypothetical protein